GDHHLKGALDHHQQHPQGHVPPVGAHIAKKAFQVVHGTSSFCLWDWTARRFSRARRRYWAKRSASSGVKPCSSCCSISPQACCQAAAALRPFSVSSTTPVRRSPLTALRVTKPPFSSASSIRHTAAGSISK